MTIMKNGLEIEKITLSDYEEQGEEAMHALFKEKGFVKKSPEEIKASLEARFKAEEDKRPTDKEARSAKTLNDYKAAFEKAQRDNKEL